MDRIMLGIFIVITIIYVAFTIRGTFVTKKQIGDLCIIDIVYCIIAGFCIGTLDMIVALAIAILLALCLTIILHKRQKNLIERNRKMIQEKEEAN